MNTEMNRFKSIINKQLTQVTFDVAINYRNS